MKLSFPVTCELLTLDFSTYKSFESALRRQHDLSILQYRAMSLIHQRGGIAESRMIEALDANASQLSQNLSKLLRRDYVSWMPAAGSARSWSITKLGRAALEEADITVIRIYNQYFVKLSSDLEQSVIPGLRMTSQSQGIIRVKDGGYFDEQAFFESVLSAVQTVTESLQQFDLSPVQFRILFELLQHGPTVKAHLAKSLMLARSTVNWACDTLVERNFVHFVAGASGRAVPVLLTESGRAMVQRAAEYVDRTWCSMRVWSSEEKRYYQQVAEFFVESFM